jgi:hypothetical protein
MSPKNAAWCSTLALFALLGVIGCSREKPIHVEFDDRPEPQPELPAELFKRNQPHIREIFTWNGQIIIAADGYYVLDINKATATPLGSIDSLPIWALATFGKDQPLALCLKEHGIGILEQKGNNWESHYLPDSSRVSTDMMLLLADAESFVVVTDARAFRKSDAEWIEIPVGEHPKIRGIETGCDRHYLLKGTTVYEGYDIWQGGGALLELNLITGKWSQVDLQEGVSRRLPIRDVKVDPKGRVWVVEGSAHLADAEGVVHCRDGDTWKTFAKCAPSGRNVNWNLPCSSLNGITFDADGNPYILTEDLGVAHHDGTRWRILTSGWPRDQYATSFHAADDGLLVIGTLNSGVLLWDRKANKVRRVNLTDPGAVDKGGSKPRPPNRYRIR